MREWVKKNASPLSIGFLGVIVAVLLLHSYADHKRIHIIDSWGASVEKRLKEANIK